MVVVVVAACGGGEARGGGAVVVTQAVVVALGPTGEGVGAHSVVFQGIWIITPGALD